MRWQTQDLSKCCKENEMEGLEGEPPITHHFDCRSSSSTTGRIVVRPGVALTQNGVTYDPRLEEDEQTILYLMFSVACFVRGLYAAGATIPVTGHPVDISFCFEVGSPMREQPWDGYKLNDYFIEEWESIDQLLYLLKN